jgi:hypothetical protein
MQDSDGPASKTPEILGLVGLALAVLGISELPLAPRLACLLGASFCLPLSFHGQDTWPSWVRWVLSLASNALLAYVAWSVIRGY